MEDPCSSVSAELWRCLGENPLWRVYIFRVNAEESKFQCNVEVCNPVLQKRCEILLILKIKLVEREKCFLISARYWVFELVSDL